MSEQSERTAQVAALTTALHQERAARHHAAAAHEQETAALKAEATALRTTVQTLQKDLEDVKDERSLLRKETGEEAPGVNGTSAHRGWPCQSDDSLRHLN